MGLHIPIIVIFTCALCKLAYKNGCGSLSKWLDAPTLNEWRTVSLHKPRKQPTALSERQSLTQLTVSVWLWGKTTNQPYGLSQICWNQPKKAETMVSKWMIMRV